MLSSPTVLKWTCLFFLTTLFSCGNVKDEDKNLVQESAEVEKPDDFFLDEEDFKTTKLRDISTTDLKDKIKEPIYYLFKSETSEETELEKCLIQKLEDGFEHTLSDDKKTATITVVTDTLDCMETLDKEYVGYKTLSSHVRSYIQASCHDQEMEGLKLDTLNDFEESIYHISCKKFSVRSQQEVIINAEVSNLDTGTVKAVRTNYRNVGLDFKMPCEFERGDDNILKVTDCTETEYDSSKFTEESGEETLMESLFHLNRKGPLIDFNDSDRKFYAPGKATGKFNDWELTITFPEGDSAPTWTAKKGIEEVEGTYSSN